MRWRDSTGGLVVGALLVSMLGAGACARNPSPATPASAPSGKASDAPGRNLYGFYFDPQGADFTIWINHLKNDVYRKWIMPRAALLGFKGHVDFEFTVERDGTLSALRMLKSSGAPTLDRAARNALTASRCPPLPDDYGPPRLTLKVSLFYNEAPR